MRRKSEADRQRSQQRRDRMVRAFFAYAESGPRSWETILEERGYLSRTSDGAWYWPSGDTGRYRLPVRRIRTLWYEHLSGKTTLGYHEFLNTYNVPRSFDDDTAMRDPLPPDLATELRENGW